VRPAGNGSAKTNMAFAAFGVLLASLSPLSAQTGPVVARAASVTGPALVYSGAAASTFALSAGFLLNPGDQVDTRGGGRVVIDLSDGSMVVVEPQSLIVIKDFRQAESLRELFEILVGKVRVRINHFGGRPNPYRMNSPTASLAVRGTEFSIEVGPGGETQVMVYEGAVEVTSLSDPSQSVLVEAGRGVLVQAGQDFHMLAAMLNPPLARPGANGDRRVFEAAGGAGQPADPVPAGGNTGDGSGGLHPHHQSDAPRATASAYDSYVAGLSDNAQTPFLFRFDAFPEAHLDSLENPAYATQFRSAEARVFLLPTYGGGPNLDSAGVISRPAGSFPSNFSISPQISIFSPVGHSNFFVGGSVSVSRLNNNTSTAFSAGDVFAPGQAAPATLTAGGSTSSFYSGSLVAARRMGATSLGVGLDSLRGSGSLSSTTVSTDPDGDTGGPSVERLVAASRISQTRLTAGLTRDFGHKAKLGVFYRYGWISAADQDLGHTVNNVPVGLGSTGLGGHSAEIGFRLRGTITPRLFYGATGSWLGVSLAGGLVQTGTADSHARDRSQRNSAGFGVGYALSRRFLVTADTAAGASRVASSLLEDATGNLLQNGAANGHFLSAHAAVQVNLTRRFFLSASLLNVWRAQHVNVDLFPDQFGWTSVAQDSFFPLSTGAYQLAPRFSDFGAGWSFSPKFFAQYLFTTDYGVTSSSHALMLRYTFKLGKGE
jgi:FecR protein